MDLTSSSETCWNTPSNQNKIQQQQQNPFFLLQLNNSGNCEPANSTFPAGQALTWFNCFCTGTNGERRLSFPSPASVRDLPTFINMPHCWCYLFTPVAYSHSGSSLAFLYPFIYTVGNWQKSQMHKRDKLSSPVKYRLGRKYFLMIIQNELSRKISIMAPVCAYYKALLVKTS